MPDTDLDAELSCLREELRGSLPVPAFSQVVARHKQRVVRRRMQIGAVVAVLVVSLAVPLLRDQMAPDPPEVATPPPVEGLTPTGPFIAGAEFADPDHGYVIRAKCKTGPRACTSELLATDDGQHWRKRDLPRPDSAPSWSMGNLEVLGPDEITVDWPLSPVNETLRIHRSHSVDGGVTWETVLVPDVVTDTVPAIPEGGVLTQNCVRLAGAGGQCAERGVVVVLPGSGKSAALANRPPLTAMLAGTLPTRDGVWWMAGRDPATDHWGLAVSDDDGRTWTTTVLDWGEPVHSYGWSVDSQGGTLYATAIGTLPSATNGLLGVFASTDGGHSWQQTWRPAAGKEPRRVYRGTVVGEDGTLTIGGYDGKQYRSDDGGRTFTEVRARYTGYTQRSRIGYLADATDAGADLMASADGIHWRKIKIG